MGLINALTEQMTREKALEQAQKDFDAVQNVVQNNYNTLGQTTPVVPTSDAERINLERSGYIPTEGGYVTPQSQMMANERQYLDYEAQQNLDAYKNKLQSPLFNVGDTLVDAVNNTVGLPIKFLSGGQNLITDPSKALTKGYQKSLEDIKRQHAENQGALLQDRDRRSKTFLDSLRGGGQDPAAVRTFMFRQSLGDGSEEQKIFDRMQTYSNTSKLSTGDSTLVVDRQGNVVSQFDQNLAPREELDYLGNASRVQSGGTTAGKFIAEAKTLYPTMNEKQKELEKTVKYIKNHKGLDAGTGLSSYLDISNYTPGSDAYNFRAYARQAQGKVFEAAYDSLKGGGTITEFETQAMADAMTRMDTATSKEEYLKAVDDFVSAQKRGVKLIEIASKSTNLDDYLDNYKIYEARQRGDSLGNTSDRETSSVDDLVSQYAD